MTQRWRKLSWLIPRLDLLFWRFVSLHVLWSTQFPAVSWTHTCLKGCTACVGLNTYPCMPVLAQGGCRSQLKLVFFPPTLPEKERRDPRAARHQWYIYCMTLNRVACTVTTSVISKVWDLFMSPPEKDTLLLLLIRLSVEILWGLSKSTEDLRDLSLHYSTCHLEAGPKAQLYS